MNSGSGGLVPKEKDKQRPLAFSIVRFIARLMLRSQYREIEIEGAERFPQEGAVLIVANHFSSLVDSMALLHASPRASAFLAKAPLWKSAVLSPFLNAVGAVPVYRPQDVGENEGLGVRANLKTLKACRERLEQGACMALFPEGVSQSRPRLMEIRTGAARIALDAKCAVTIMPAGLIYETARQDRRGTLLVRFGEPFVVDGHGDYPSRRAAITSVTRRIEADLRDLLAEADSQSDMVALRTLRVVWEQERGERLPTTLSEEHRRTRRYARHLATLARTQPEAVEELRANTDAYVRSLELAGLPAELLQGHYTFKGVLRFLLTKGLPTLLGLPFAWVAAIGTWPVRRFGDIVGLRAFGGGEDVRALCRMLGGGLLLFWCMLGGGLAAGLLWGPWAALGVVVGLPALLAFHIAWQDRHQHVRTHIHAFLLLAGGTLRTALQEERHALYEQLLALEEHL